MIVGYYVNCDEAMCLDHSPTTEAWREAGGFEGWLEPLPIDDDEAVDSPIHCTRCESLLPVTLTEAGVAYAWEAIVEGVTSSSGRPVIHAQWWLAYKDEIIDQIFPDNDDTHQLVDVAVTFLDTAAYSAPAWDVYTPIDGIPLVHRRRWVEMRHAEGLSAP